ncbi:hypothetical protein [Thermacetogenium phaeum]|nr:hypothetical protein [Thermacetogenium phaeum]
MKVAARRLPEDAPAAAAADVRGADGAGFPALLSGWGVLIDKTV